MFPGVFVHDTIDWMSASFDGITLEQDAICEIKCPGKKDHAIALKGKIPTKYIPQLQHQIYVSGLSLFSYYYSFDGESGVVIEVKRDQEFIDKMVEKEFEFWNCLMSLTPPKYEITIKMNMQQLLLFEEPYEEKSQRKLLEIRRKIRSA